MSVLAGREEGRGVGPCECVAATCSHARANGGREFHQPAFAADQHAAPSCRFKPGSEIDIGMRVRLVDGDVLIADSDTDGGFVRACEKFKEWVRAKYFGSDGGTGVAQE